MLSFNQLLLEPSNDYYNYEYTPVPVVVASLSTDTDTTLAKFKS